MVLGSGADCSRTCFHFLVMSCDLLTVCTLGHSSRFIVHSVSVPASGAFRPFWCCAGPVPVPFQEALVLSYEDSPLEDSMPYLGCRLSPLPVTCFVGRSARRAPPCPVKETVWWWFKDLVFRSCLSWPCHMPCAYSLYGSAYVRQRSLSPALSHILCHCSRIFHCASSVHVCMCFSWGIEHGVSRAKRALCVFLQAPSENVHVVGSHMCCLAPVCRLCVCVV